MSPRQRRGLLLLALAVAAAVGTWAAVLRWTDQVSAQLGPTRPVLVVVAAVDAWSPVGPGQVGVKDVPRVFAPPGALARYEDLAGRVSPVDLPVGTVLQEPGLVPVPVLRNGERAAVVSSDEVAGWPQALAPGDSVDLVVAWGRGDKARSALEAAAVRVLAVADPEPTGTRRSAPRARATLALTGDQVLALARARGAAARITLTLLPPTEDRS